MARSETTAADGDVAPPGLRLAVQTEGAFSRAVGPFYNHLAGARLDYRFTPSVALGGYLGYANLKGKDGRTHNVLPYIQLEYRYAPVRGSALRVPLRFATGHLPRNGPIVQIAAGLAYPLSPRVELGAQLFAPTVWITRNQALLSMNLAIELAFGL